jgi:hypothetical protein
MPPFLPPLTSCLPAGFDEAVLFFAIFGAPLPGDGGTIVNPDAIILVLVLGWASARQFQASGQPR